jgi:peptide/nickel transport system substrate-binding protein
MSALLAALLTGGCAAGSARVTDVGASGGTSVEGGTATTALPPAAGPDWIFPIGAPAICPRPTARCRTLLYPPLYQPVRKGGTLTVDNRATSPSLCPL